MIDTSLQSSLAKLDEGKVSLVLKRNFSHFSAPTSPAYLPYKLSYFDDSNDFSAFPKEDMNQILFENFVKKDSSSTMARITYFFDDGYCGGFLSIPHLGRHGSASTAAVARILERWLVEKTSNPKSTTTIIPILEEPIELITSSIIDRLKAEGGEQLGSIAKVGIRVNAGHIFTLDRCCEDEGVKWAAQKFQQEYPLFLDLSIHTVPFPSDSVSSLEPFVNDLSPSSSTSSHSSISYTKASFSSASPGPTEILLNFQKIHFEK